MRDVDTSDRSRRGARRARLGTWWRGAVLVPFVVSGASACSAQPAAPDRETMFLCTVDAPKLALDKTQICGTFKAEIDRALKAPTLQADADDGAARGDLIAVTLRQVSPVTLSATVTQRSDGQTHAHPAVSVDVSDKPIGQSDIAMLAAEVAKVVAQFDGQ